MLLEFAWLQTRDFVIEKDWDSARFEAGSLVMEVMIIACNI
jgi:hypothetical protein